MIKVRLYGNLGNQMFQYAFAHLLAQKLKKRFMIDSYYVNYSLNYFKLSFPYNLLQWDFVLKIYSKIQTFIRFKKVFDFNNLLLDNSAYAISDKAYYVGYFQDASLYTDNRASIRELFELRPKYKREFKEKYQTYFNTGKKIITVSVRLGDYKHLYIKELNDASVLLPITWYKKQLEEELCENSILFVISDNIEEAHRELGMNHKETVYVKDSIINQFQLLQSSDVCIIANSTFAWWGGFLNHKSNSRIIAPMNWAGYNSGKEYPKGIMSVSFEWKY